MTIRKLLTMLRWSLLTGAALFVAGVGPFAGGDAGGLTGSAGPVTVTVSPAVNLSDGQVVTIHAQSNDPGTVVYALRAHLCHPGMVKGDTSFSLDNPQCTSVPVGQSDVEQRVTVAGAPSGDLQFRVGTGAASWITTIGLDGSLTCDAANPCDLVTQIEVSNSTVYFRAPLCFGTTCPADADPNVPATPVPAAATGGTDSGSSGAVPEASDAATGKPTEGGSTAVGSARGAGTSSSSAGGDESELASAQSASAVSVPSDGPSRGVRVLIALVAGVFGGARIVTIVNRSCSRGITLGTT